LLSKTWRRLNSPVSWRFCRAPPGPKRRKTRARFGPENPSGSFALYRNDGKIDDWTTIKGIRRGHFRLHPVGRIGESSGYITVKNPAQFEKLRLFLKAQLIFQVPGAVLRAYGKVIVR
ncbi:tlde1 domain-containing protein, partial [Burkholderia gladioli]|uniref:tlde1 domain-containing protein n=1 Tax=Burkholderia gladioli TaxID=28095 RepID=UPI0016416856